MLRLERLAELSADGFEPFLTLLWDYVKREQLLDEEVLPEGIGEVSTPLGVIEYAVARPSCFAALRWRRGAVCHEAFCVQPEGLPALVGHTELCSPSDSEPAEEHLCPSWWTTLQPLLSDRQLEKPLPSFLQLACALTGGGPSQVSTASTNTAMESLTHELAYFKDLCEDQGEELRQLRIKLREMSALSSQQAHLAPANDTEEAEADEVQDLRGLPQWAQDNVERIAVLPRALGGAKKSIYARPSAVYRALDYLAGPYRDYRLNRITKPALDEALARAGLKVAGSVAPNVAGEQGEAYYVQWDGRRRFLEQHLLRGGGRDERYCLRVYYFWDDVSQRAVVGWLPSHLSNSLS